MTLHLRLLGNEFEIRLLDRGDPALENNMGALMWSRQIMAIDKNMAADQVFSTILHEIIEGLGVALDLGLSHPQISGMEAGLFAIFRDNGVDLSPLLHE